MRREVNLDPRSTFDLIGSAETVVIYVGPLATLDNDIAAHFETFGHVDSQCLDDFARSSELATALVNRFFRGNGAGWSAPPTPCGYYLFLKRALHGHDLGMPRSRETADRITRYFDRQIARFRRYPYLLDLPVNADTDALECLLDGTPPENRRSVATCIALYEAGRKAGGR